MMELHLTCDKEKKNITQKNYSYFKSDKSDFTHFWFGKKEIRLVSLCS